jgi:4-amino-4-deoxy-L-arabinose transferase-like glycosyltransferase
LAWPLTFWFCIAAGILTKGPITPMIAGLAIVTLGLLAGRWRWVGSLRPALGVLVVAALVLPWVIAVGQRVGWVAYAQTIFDETLGRSAAPKEGHWGPPGYHLVLLTVLMWPGSLLTGWALLHDRARDAAGSGGVAARIRRWFSDDPARRFLLAWAAPSWLVFELVSTKLPHYTMPLYPALALLSAQALVRVHDGDRRITDLGTRVGLGIWWVVGVAATLGLSGVVLWAGRLEDGVSLDDSVRNYVAPAVLIVLFLVAAGRSLVRGALLRAQLQAMVAIVAWGATFLHYVLPGAQRFWVASRVVAAMETTGATRLVNNSSFTEDSLVFLTRGRITRDDGDSPGDAARLLSAEPTADGQTTPPPAAAIRIRGFNYSTGRTVDLWLTRPAAAPEAPSP